MAGEEAKKHFSYVYRLFGHVFHVSHYHCADIGYLDFHGYSGRLSSQLSAIGTVRKVPDRHSALCTDVGYVHCTLYLHAQHKGTAEVCAGARHTGGYRHAGPADILHPLANVLVEL